MRRKRVVVNDLMQRNYAYRLTEPAGRDFHPDFKLGLRRQKYLAG